MKRLGLNRQEVQHLVSRVIGGRLERESFLAISSGLISVVLSLLVAGGVASSIYAVFGCMAGSIALAAISVIFLIDSLSLSQALEKIDEFDGQ